MKRPIKLTLLLLLAAPVCIVIALLIGSIDITPQAFLQVLSGEDTGTTATVLHELRLPRALTAFAVGGLLALSGTLLQVLLRNPLADPYILGVSGGAGAAALASILFGLSGVWITGNAFAGSLLSMFLVFSLSRGEGPWTQTRLLLTGIVTAAGWAACISFLLVISPQGSVQGMLFWLMGDLSLAQQPGLGNILLIFGLAVSFALARALNLLARGELSAAALGENPNRIRVIVYFLASLLTAGAVTLAGSIGFVGLIIPHALRLLGVTDHRWLLPNAVLLGGSFLVLADTLARTVLAPMQLPVGIITAFLGVPVFLYLLAYTRNT